LVLKSTIQELLSGKTIEDNGDYAKSIIATSDGNYIIEAIRLLIFPATKRKKHSTDVWLLKINDLGQILWQKILAQIVLKHLQTFE
jgi:hypothetical protein